MADDIFLSGTGVIASRRGAPVHHEPTNPVTSDAYAVSLNEVQELIDQASAGFYRSMDPKSPLGNLGQSSTAEVSMLNAARSMPKPTHEMVYRVVAGGVCRCTAGGPVDFTVRLRNSTDTLLIAEAVVSLATDTEGNRPWRFEAVGEGNVFLSAGLMSTTLLTVGAGNTDTLKQDMHQSLLNEGTDPQNWDLSVQFSVSNAGIFTNPYFAQVQYAIAGL